MTRTDGLVIVNGPEDGTEFPIVRAPFDVGRDLTCAAQITLDVAVRPQHARVWAVSDGYRVRRLHGGPVYVDGKRVGRIRSRILRPGGILQVGHTLLALECAPDGLAHRSRGLVTHSDIAWLLRSVGTTLFSSTTWLAGAVTVLPRFLLKQKMLIAAGLVGLYFFWPPFRYTVNVTVQSAVNCIVGFASNLLSSRG